MTNEGQSDTAIELRAVSKHFGHTEAVRDLTLAVPKGRALGFLGPNGAGKTTTIKLLMGLLRASAGRVSVLNLDPSEASVAVKTRVGYVPEQHFIHGWMRVDEAIAFCRTFYPTWNDRLCGDLVKLFGLDGRKRVREMSKGTVVKLSLVLALSHEPEVLILDEPMAGLDPLVREELLDGVLQTMYDGKRTILFSSHTFSDVQRLADTVAIIDEGELLIHCAVDDLLRSTKRIRAVLSDGSAPAEHPDGAIWQRVKNREWLVTVSDFSTEQVERLRSHNHVEHVEVIDLGLEDIFKDYIRGRRSLPCT